jgi:hypothetical protein
MPVIPDSIRDPDAANANTVIKKEERFLFLIDGIGFREVWTPGQARGDSGGDDVTSG